MQAVRVSILASDVRDPRRDRVHDAPDADRHEDVRRMKRLNQAKADEAARKKQAKSSTKTIAAPSAASDATTQRSSKTIGSAALRPFGKDETWNRLMQSKAPHRGQSLASAATEEETALGKCVGEKKLAKMNAPDAPDKGSGIFFVC